MIICTALLHRADDFLFVLLLDVFLLRFILAIPMCKNFLRVRYTLPAELDDSFHIVVLLSAVVLTRAFDNVIHIVFRS